MDTAKRDREAPDDARERSKQPRRLALLSGNRAVLLRWARLEMERQFAGTRAADPDEPLPF